MKTLIIDIETSPIIADVWGLWDQNIGLNQIHAPTRMICFAAKWLGESKTMFWSEYHDSKDAMVAAAWTLLNDSDAVVHFNGASFDIPHLNREFLLAGLPPPAPFKQIDLLRVIKRNFKFPSNKLAYVTSALGLETKVSHEGHSLWTKCLAGDDAAWTKMRRYNKKDVDILEPLYLLLLPWVQGHPNVALYGVGDDTPTGPTCPNCGGMDLRKEGHAYTATAKFQRYKCAGCSSWSRGSRSTNRVGISGLAR